MRRPLAILIVTVSLLASVLAPPAGAETPPADVAAEDFITQQYLDFLARPPDAAGLDFWVGRLRAGVDPAALIDTMVSSPEFEGVVAPVVRLYLAHFRRSPDSDGLTFWAAQMNSGWTISRVSEFFAQSQEFQQTYGALSDGAYVDLVYQNVLGRAPDTTGRAFWIQELNRGLSRGALMAQFSESPENQSATFGRVRATMLYLGMLRRAPEAAGLAFWAGQIDAGVPYRDVMSGFLYSAEYAARMSQLFPQRHPLTGKATANATGRPALAAKIDNTDAARPQTGINDADVVYEELVEGNLTRLIAVFQGRAPAVIGPVRSVRTSDFHVLTQFNTPILAASGANPGVRALLAGVDLVNADAIEAGGAYFRSTSRSAPHNLYGRTANLRSFAGSRGGTPPAVFRYLAAGDSLPGGARASAGVDLNFGRNNATYRWSAANQGWLRNQNGSPHRDAAGVQVAPQNVVVLITPYGVSPVDANSPEAITVGNGQAFVFTQGTVVEGTWSRNQPTERILLRDAGGAEIRLTTGTTWVALAPAGTVVVR